MFGNTNPSVILYLTPTELHIYSSTKEDTESVTFATPIISGAAPVTLAVYKQELSDFLIKTEAKNTRALLILGVGTYLSQELVLEKQIKETEASNAFFKTVPYDNEKTAKKTLKSGKELIFLAAHKDIYEPIIQVCLENDITISSVIPSSIFNGLNQPTLTPDQVKIILHHTHQLQHMGNLLDENPPDTLSPAMAGRGINKKWFIIIPVIILLLGGTVFAIQKIKTLPVPALFASPTPTPTPTAIPTPTPTPIPITDKEAMKLQVLNGSGVVGQAGVVKQALEKAGFKDIKTDNAPSYDNSQTTVAYKPGVSEKIREETVTTLKKILSNVEEKEDKSLSTYDMVITTAK